MEKFQKQEEKGWDQSRALKGGFFVGQSEFGKERRFQAVF